MGSHLSRFLSSGDGSRWVICHGGNPDIKLEPKYGMQCFKVISLKRSRNQTRRNGELCQ